MRVVLSLVGLTLLGGALPLAAAGSVADPEIRFLGNEGHVVVIEHDGSSYDRDAADGSLNVDPRQRIARELIATHGDFYDFIVVFTNFEFDRGGSNGFYLGIRNGVVGIGRPLVDNGDAFGSPRTLQGYIDMGPVGQYRDDPFSLTPTDPRFRRTLSILAHELGHRWLADVRYDDGDGNGGSLETDLLGRDGVHWSFLLSSDASFLYGNRWEPLAGTPDLYRSVETQARFSELDLYLMGFLAPEDVSPLTLLVNPEVDPARLPELGAEIEATESKTIAISQIVAAEGVRSPDHEASQKEFSVAFVLLTAPRLVPSDTDLAAIERVRSSFTESFFALTRGRALVDPDLLDVAPRTPATEPDTTLALAWLLAQQKADGRFEAHPLTAIRDTATAVAALGTMGVRGPPLDGARAFLGSGSPAASVDFLARAIAAGAELPVARLESFVNDDGGYGIAPGYQSDPLDTALALKALVSGQSPEASGLADRLVSMQLPDGSWSSIPGGLGDVLTTSEAVLALELADSAPGALSSALAWLVTRQQEDGGFGEVEGPSTPYATALVLEALLSATVPPNSIDRAIDYLSQTQSANGSWNGSVFETASVLRAVVPSTLPNLAIDLPELTLDPDPPEVGETVLVEVTVRNRSRVSAGPFDVQLFDGDPEVGGQPIGAPRMLPGLDAGAHVSLAFDWDTTGFPGERTIVAIADLVGALAEISKDDNVAVRDVEVLPPLPNLVVALLTAEPSRPIQGSSVTVSARIENRGSAPAGTALVELFREVPRLGIALGADSVGGLPPGGAQDVTFLWDTTGFLGSHRLHAAIDRGNAVRERFENDNETSLALDVRPPPPAQPDLEIESFALTPDELVELPREVMATARIANTGLDPVPDATVTLYLGHPASGGAVVASQSLPVPGDSGADLEIPFTVTEGGTRTYYLAVDPGGTLERDPSNNIAAAVLRDRMDVIDVALVPGSVVLSATSLAPGEVLSVDVTIRNTGTRPLSSVALELLYELSLGGEKRRASLVNLPLAPGESRVATLSWKANRSGTVRLELVADPGDVLAETREDDNRLTATVDVAASALPNLTLAAADIQASPTPLREGEDGLLEALVRNVGDSDSGPFDVRFFTDDSSIATTNVPSLAPGSSTLVNVSWSPVRARGTTLVHVAVDPENVVPEIDDLDNEIFRVFDVLGLADLVATSGELRMTPAFPRSGDDVVVDASFRNAGEQASPPMAVELRLDDPVAGALIGDENLGALDPGESGDLSFPWSTSGIAGEHSLYLVLDVRNDVPEQQEGNNVVRLPVALQDSDVFVTPLYFSPNGDGVQDEATLFYRTSSASPLRVEVRDGGDVSVRRIAAGAQPNDSATWDGRDDRGSLAADGEYFFVVLADGAEILRRRVVLDTNRSRVVEALGTELVAGNPLTCPLPEDLLGPAWLPDDSAAYVIVTRADPDAPDYPVGLYRVAPDGSSVASILADESFEDFEFAGSPVPFPSQRVRAVAASGEHALVRSSTGLHVLDLASGERLQLDPDFDASGVWTSDGARILVSSASGLSFYDARGNLLDTLVAEAVETAILTPDDLRIVYHRRGEPVLRTMGADGTSDRALPSTDPSELFENELDPDLLELNELFYLRSRDAFVYAWTMDIVEETVGPFVLDVDADAIEDADFFSELSLDETWQMAFVNLVHSVRRVSGREIRSIVSALDGSEPHWSYRDTQITYRGDGGEGCVGDGLWRVRSLLNGEAELRLTQLPSRFGVRITGTAADRNLDVYLLEFAPAATPRAFAPIQPPARDAVIASTFTTWLPPAPGDYFVRLTVRDKAGNVSERLERILWNETPPIASLRRAPAYLSPNADGVADVLLVEYDVLTPVNLVFRIRDAEGVSVRAIPRDEASAGPASFTWDGTDDTGVPVPDGRYVLEIQGAEIPVFVDQTPPELAAAYSSLYTNDSKENDPKLAVDLEGSLGDETLERWELADPQGEVLFWSQRNVEGGILAERLRPVQGLELRARDRAGNVTVVPLVGPSREVRVLRAAGRDPVVGPTVPGDASPVPPQFLSPRSALGLRAGKSFAAEMRFVYQAEGDPPSPIEIPTNGDVFLRASDLALGTRYLGRFEAEGILSNVVAFTVGPEAIFVAASVAGAPSRVQVRVTSTVGEPLVEGRVLRASGKVTSVLKSYAPVPAVDVVSDDVPHCSTSVSYLVEATGASGTLYRSTTEVHYPSPASFTVTGKPCLSVDDAGIESHAAPGASIPERASASLSHDALAERPERLELLLDGSAVGSVEGDALGTGKAVVPFDVTAVAEGGHKLTTRAVLPKGGGVVDGDFGLSFFLDQSLPEVIIASPIEGGNVCVVSDDNREAVAFDVIARDRQLKRLAVELHLNGEWVPLGLTEPIDFPISGELQRRLHAVVPSGLAGDAVFRVVATSARISGELGFRPSLPGAKLWPSDINNGSLIATVTRNVVVSRALPIGPLSTEPSFPTLFSPNGDTVSDELVVRGEAREDVTFTVRVFTTGASRTLVRTALSGVGRNAGPFAVVWDGRDDLGLVVSDGEYEIEVEAVNGCGATSTARTRATVDATPPDVGIENLVAGQPVAIGVTVVGTADDPHLDSYVLEYGEASTPSSFTEVAPPESRRVKGKPLGYWSLGGIPPGPKTLRLTASDTVGNVALAAVVVDVQTADFIVGHEAEPPLFSPNGDDVFDSTVISFEIRSDARVTLAVLGPGDVTVATLVNAELTTAGIVSLPWDGLAVADGEYTVLLRAEHPDNEALFDESRLTVAVDTQAPTLVIASPVTSGFLSSPGTITGTIDDPNLESYRVEAGPSSAALNVVASDTLPASGVLAAVRFEDGSYRLRATASDRAGNASELTRNFSIDGTAPRLTLVSPAGESYIGPSPPSVAIAGSVVEANVSDFELALGYGAAPSSFVPLAAGPSVPAGPLGTWDLDGLPDGPYRLRLSVTDEAMNFAAVATKVTLDKTSPTVVLVSPEDGSAIAGRLDVLGSLNDASFAEGQVLLAPASAPSQLTEVAAFDAPWSGDLLEGFALPDGEYVVALRAVDLAGNVASASAGFLVDTEPPEAPSALRASVSGRDVTLSWIPSPSLDVAGYHVSRDGVRITTAPVPSSASTFVDANRPEGRYAYIVMAVDRAALESEKAGPAAAVVDLTPPVVALRSPDDGDRVRVLVEILGTAYSENDFSEYRLFVADAATPLALTLLARGTLPITFDTLGRWQPISDGDYILTLEAEDVTGNRASDSVRVTVDNEPPGAPVLVRAGAQTGGADVEIEWEASASSDVEGYLVFRNGQIANAPGNVSGSVTPFLVPGPIHLDPDLPDGEHCYRVVAVDLASNSSLESNELCELLDNRAPSAAIVEPTAGERFDAPRLVRAVVEDRDVASVAFEYRPAGAPGWNVIAVDTDSPFEALWDVSGLAFGDYHLRAVATDIGTRQDPDPGVVDVVLADSTPPASPADVVATVSGADVLLSWTGVVDADLAAYRILRDGAIALTVDASTTDATEAGVPDGSYEYTVVALDGGDNESAPSGAAPVRIYAPVIRADFPVYVTPLLEIAGGNLAAEADVRLLEAGTANEVATTAADGSGAFAFAGLDFQPGQHRFEVVARDASGNASRRSEAILRIRNEAPVTPAGFDAVANGDEAHLSWDQNAEVDLSGYVVTRNGDTLNPRGELNPGGDIPVGANVNASTGITTRRNVFDGNPSSSWNVSSTREEWVEVTLDAPRHIEAVEIQWAASLPAADYDLFVDLEGTDALVARVRGNTQASRSSHTLAFPVLTTRVRLHIYSGASPFGVRVAETWLSAILPEATTSFTDRPSTPGFYDYAVSAIDSLGGRSIEAGPLNRGIGDLSPPEPPTDLTASAAGEDVRLDWTASVSPDTVSYQVFRDGALAGSTTTTSFDDLDLLNGEYTYTVVAVDAAGNASIPSLPAVAAVEVAPPTAPTLAVDAVASGSALTLMWTPSTAPLGVEAYVLASSEIAGGPHTDIAQVDATSTSYTDSGLENGVEKFYVVRALDQRGQPSPDSNEASGTPSDVEPPAAPVWLAPTTPGTPIIVNRSRQAVVGSAEPDTTVEVFRDGVRLGEAVVSDTFRQTSESFLQSSVNPARLSVSPAGTLLAEVGTPFFLDSEIRLHDLRTGDVRTVPYDGARSFERGAAFSPDGKRIVVTTTLGTDVSLAVRVVDLESGTTAVYPMAAAPQTPAFLSDLEVALFAGGDLERIDVMTGAAVTLHSTTADVSAISPRLTASADGSYLAWREGDQLYVLPSTGGTPALVQETSELEAFAWVGNDVLAITRWDNGLSFHDTGTGALTVVTGTAGMERPRALGIEGAVSTVRESHLFVTRTDGTVVDLGETPLFAFADLMEWSYELGLVGVSSFEVTRFETPGRYSFVATLEAGPNLLTAVAIDAGANESPSSESIEIRFDPSSLADLAFEGPLAVLPAAPVSGQPASLSVSVRNAGPSTSEPGLVSFGGVDPDGVLYAIGSNAVPALEPGASVTVSRLWPTTGRLGTQTLVAAIDPLEIVDESDETNNVLSITATVVGAAGVETSVTTGRSSYGAGDIAELTVAVVNGGASRSLELETVIEDAANRRVAVVDSRSVALDYAQSSRYAVFWEVGSVSAGDYFVRLRAHGGAGLVSSAEAPFTITGSFAIGLTALPEQPAYRQGDDATLLARVVHLSGNTPLRDLSLRYRLLDAGQALVFETVRPLGYLALDGEIDAQAVWPVGAAEPGLYRLLVDAFEGGALVASTSADVAVEALAAPRLTGVLDAPPSSPAESDFVVNYRIDNESPLALTSGLVRASLVDVAQARVVRSDEAPLSIGGLGSTSGELRIGTAGLALGGHRVVLSAGLVSAPEALATSSTTIFGVPSPPSLNAPSAGASAAQRLALSVNNASNPNNEVLTYAFELYLDPSLRSLVASATSLPEGANATRWDVPRHLEENRRYYWRARAADRFAVSDWMAPAEVLVDSENEAPDAPSVASPLEMSEVDTLRPALVVTNALDPEGDALTYAFEVYRDSALGDRVVEVSGIPEGATTTSFVIPAELDEDATYFWRAQANDGELDSEWSKEVSFRVNTANHAPSAPVPLSPKETRVATLTPELVVRPSLDPEAGPVTHRFQIDVVATFDSGALQEEVGLPDDRWTPTMPLSENAIYYWRARGHDGFAASGWSETASFRVDVTNEPPAAPTPQGPVDGALVATTTPVLSVVNAADPEDDVLRYTFEVYEDAAMAVLAARIDALPEGNGRTAWAVSPRLLDETRYYWRAIASDLVSDSPPSPLQSFHVNLMNEAPTAPVLVSPRLGANVPDAMPLLVVSNALDPDGDALTYVFEVYADEALTTLVEASPAIPEGAGETSWTMGALLEENDVYYWRARAFDSALDGPWMDTARFRFSSFNEAPSSPVPFAPSDGEVVAEARPTLAVTNAADPEDDARRYVFEVFRDASLSDLVVRSGEVDEATPRTSWPVELDLDENTAFYWRAIATDGSLASAPSDVFQFVVNAVDEPPTVPVLLAPADGAVIGTTSPRLEIENATSPDGDPGEPLHYHFALYADDALTDLLAADDQVPQGSGRTGWEPPVVLSAGSPYYWTARAIDARGSSSDWAQAFEFTVEPPPSDCPPEWREDFESATKGKPPAGFRLEKERFFPYFFAADTEGSRRLVSALTGRGSLFFQGSASVLDWRNYALEGVLEQKGLDFDGHSRCDFRSGVWFYARPGDTSEKTEGYRLELTGPRCNTPEARIVKVAAGGSVELARTALPKAARRDLVRFHIETVNATTGTSLRLRLTIDDEERRIDFEDIDAPLRGGTVGAWSNFVVATWDDFFVSEVPGLESGISGDLDGDGVCDASDGGCADPVQVCLDEGFDETTGLSHAVHAIGGDAGHSGPDACGYGHSYWVKKGTGVLFVHTPDLSPGEHRLTLLVRRGFDRKISVGLPDGRTVNVMSSSDDDDDDDDDDEENEFVWSRPIDVTLAAGVHEIRIESSSNAKVHVEGYRLEPACDP